MAEFLEDSKNPSGELGEWVEDAVLHNPPPYLLTWAETQTRNVRNVYTNAMQKEKSKEKRHDLAAKSGTRKAHGRTPGTYEAPPYPGM